MDALRPCTLLRSGTCGTACRLRWGGLRPRTDGAAASADRAPLCGDYFGAAAATWIKYRRCLFLPRLSKITRLPSLVTNVLPP